MALPLKAAGQITIWKNPELSDYCCAIVQIALDLLNRNVPYFGADDLPEDQKPNSTGVAGVAIKMLKCGNVIANCPAHDPENGVYHGRRSSRHKSAHGREIRLYQITNRPIAEKFLSIHRKPPEVQQTNLFQGNNYGFQMV